MPVGRYCIEDELIWIREQIFTLASSMLSNLHPMGASNIWYLENIDAEGLFCPNKMGESGKGHSMLKFKKGEYIFQPSEAANHIYYIASGRVKIGNESDGDKSMTKAILQEGEIFGELAVIGELTHRDYAQALIDTEICTMTREVMNQLYVDRHPFVKVLYKLIGNRAIEMEKRLESLVFKDSKSRILEYIIDLADKKGQRVGYEWVVRSFITHQEIANLTATSRQTVTTLLNDLRTKNILTFDRRRLLIRDLEALRNQLDSKES